MPKKRPDETIVAQITVGHDTFIIHDWEDFVAIKNTPGDIRRIAWWPKEELDLLIDGLISIRDKEQS